MQPTGRARLKNIREADTINPRARKASLALSLQPVYRRSRRNAITTKIQTMKKIHAMLHNQKIQGHVILTTVFTALILFVILTWGK